MGHAESEKIELKVLGLCEFLLVMHNTKRKQKLVVKLVTEIRGICMSLSVSGQ